VTTAVAINPNKALQYSGLLGETRFADLGACMARLKSGKRIAPHRWRKAAPRRAFTQLLSLSAQSFQPLQLFKVGHDGSTAIAGLISWQMMYHAAQETSA
jgi:hypothetical protein